MKVHIPYKPRQGQAEAHKMSQRFKLIVAHRRFGKSYYAVADMLLKGLQWIQQGKKTVKMRYIAPTYGMAKDIAFETLKELTKELPDQPPFHKKINQSELTFEWGYGDFKMIIALKGADKPDTLRGSGIIYNVLDEFQNMRADVWDKVVYPTTLDDDQSQALIIGTPQGRNKFYHMYENAKDKPNWGVMRSDIYSSGVFPRDTDDPHYVSTGDPEIDRSNLLDYYEANPTEVKPTTIEDIKEEIWNDEGPEAYQQEFELSWSPSVKGSIFKEHLTALKASGRFTHCPVDNRVPVSTAWDLGISDSTSIIFFQQVGNEVRIVNHLSGSGKSLHYFINKILTWGNANNVIWGQHLAPHDIEVREFSTGKSRKDLARDAGLYFKTVPRVSKKADAIQAARSLLPRCIIHSDLQDLLDNLQSYHYKWDDVKGTYSKEPVHDGSSHDADAFMTLAQGLPKNIGRPRGGTIIQGSINPYA